MMGRLTLSGLAVAAVMALTLPLAAQDQPGRYTMKDIDDGMLRLDTLTGEVSYCRKKEDAWVCDAAEDNRSDLVEEFARLQEENATLKNRLAEVEKRDSTSDELNLPNDADMEKMMNFMERLMRRFYAFAKSLRDQLEDGKYGEET
jgi:regulator of replication initiation timing